LKNFEVTLLVYYQAVKGDPFLASWPPVL